jgi:hypothetical protein
LVFKLKLETKGVAMKKKEILMFLFDNLVATILIVSRRPARSLLLWFILSVVSFFVLGFTCPSLHIVFKVIASLLIPFLVAYIIFIALSFLFFALKEPQKISQ